MSTFVISHNESTGALFMEPWIEKILLMKCEEFAVTVRVEDARYPGINMLPLWEQKMKAR